MATLTSSVESPAESIAKVCNDTISKSQNIQEYEAGVIYHWRTSEGDPINLLIINDSRARYNVPAQDFYSQNMTKEEALISISKLL